MGPGGRRFKSAFLIASIVFLAIRNHLNNCGFSARWAGLLWQDILSERP